MFGNRISSGRQIPRTPPMTSVKKQLEFSEPEETEAPDCNPDVRLFFCCPFTKCLFFFFLLFFKQIFFSRLTLQTDKVQLLIAALLEQVLLSTRFAGFLLNFE